MKHSMFKVTDKEQDEGERTTKTQRTERLLYSLTVLCVFVVSYMVTVRYTYYDKLFHKEKRL